MSWQRSPQMFHRNPHAQQNDHKTILITKTGLNNIAQKPTSEPKNQLKNASTKACAAIRISESLNQTKRSDWLSKFNNKKDLSYVTHHGASLSFVQGHKSNWIYCSFHSGRYWPR